MEMKPLSGDEQCLLMMFRLRAGGLVPLHSHEEAQYGIILEGRGALLTEKGEVVGRGDCYAMEPHEPHGFKAFEDVVVIDVFVPARRDYLDYLRKPDLE